MKASVLAFLTAALLMATPAAAQGLTAEDVAQGFVEAVTLCAKAKVAGGGIAQLSEASGRVSEGDASTRAFARAPEGRPVWDVLSARGIVIISEPSDAECDVVAYGPRVRPVFDSVARALTADEIGFAEVEVEQNPEAILRSFRRAGEPTVSVSLDGGEPGMPGRTFRFPMLLAFVRSN
jgi:hypothetical protein